MDSVAPIHVLLVSFPAQGHINPMLRLGKHLAARGLFVTFSTTENAGKNMRNANTMKETFGTPIGDGFIKFEFFEETLEDDDPKRKNLEYYSAQLELVGKQFVSQMIKKHAEANQPISCIINNPFLPWVCDVATENAIPCALLWIHSCAVLTTYYHYFQNLSPFPTDTEPYIDVQLPCGEVLKYYEIPDFLHPFCPFPDFKTLMLKQHQNLSKTLCILMDTFEELEHNNLNYMSKFFLIRHVGPLFKNPKALATSNNIRGDLVKTNDDCIGWLNSRSPLSVVYICMGSVLSLPQEQVDEIAYALLNSQVSFLWVLKPPQPHLLPEGFFERTSDRGKVVQWSPQEEVLAHPSVACTVTHCGWNSTMEALASGVPVLTFASWGDQVTNAKFLVDVFGVGIRLGCTQMENKILVTRGEIEKCFVEATVGPKAKELKQNALKWKKSAEAAAAHGGSSDRSLDAFVEDIKKGISFDIKKDTPQ